MNSEQNPAGIFNFNAQGNTNSPIDITIQLGKSYQFNDLLDQLKIQEKLFSLIPENDTDERLVVSKKINDLKNLIEQFKKDVLQLAQTFQSIEINTERLKRAKDYFDKGEFGEARVVLETELEQMQDEYEYLINVREDFEQNILPKLKHNSDEFLILALTTQFNYSSPNCFEETCKYFEFSINSHANKFNIFLYAYYLATNNQITQSTKYYNQFLNEFAGDLSLIEKSNALNNLAILHMYQNELDKSLIEFEEALEIYRNFTENDPNNLLTLAGILSNLGALHSDFNDYEKALKEFNEALEIRTKLAEDDPNRFLFLVGSSLIGLGNLHQDINEYELALKYYEETLEIFKNFYQEDSDTFQPTIALALNNVGGVYRKLGKYDKALDETNKALEIRRKLSENNPNAYLRDVAMTLNNLAILHTDQNECEEGSKKYREALEIFQNLAKNNPNAFLSEVASTLNNWGSLYLKQNNFDEALKRYEEALEIKRDLYSRIPEAYAPSLAMTLVNIASIYQVLSREREKSIEYLTETLILLLPIIKKVPYTSDYYVRALETLNNWGLKDEAIKLLIAKMMKKAKKNKS